MEHFAENACFQLLNAHTRAKCLLESITRSDTGLQATRDMIKNDGGLRRKLNNFELASEYLLPHDTVEKCKSIKAGSNTQATIYETTAAASST